MRHDRFLSFQMGQCKVHLFHIIHGYSQPKTKLQAQAEGRITYGFRRFELISENRLGKKSQFSGRKFGIFFLVES